MTLGLRAAMTEQPICLAQHEDLVGHQSVEPSSVCWA